MIKIPKMENNDKRSIITEEINVLQSLLDEITHKMAGDYVFLKIKKKWLNCQKVMSMQN